MTRGMIPGLHFHGFPSMVSKIYQRITLNAGGWMCPGHTSILRHSASGDDHHILGKLADNEN